MQQLLRCRGHSGAGCVYMIHYYIYILIIQLMLESKTECNSRKSVSSHMACITCLQYLKRSKLQHSSRKSCWESTGPKGHNDIILFGLSLLPYITACVLRLLFVCNR